MEKKLYYVATGEEEPALVVETGGKEYRLNSAYSPSNEVEIWGRQFAFSHVKKVACLFGMGTGLFAEKLLSVLSKDSLLIIFEPDREIYDYCRRAGAEGETAEKMILDRIERILSDKRVLLCVDSEDSLAFREQLFAKLDYYMLEGLIVAKHTAYDRLYENAFLKYLHTINEVREQILVNKNTLARFKDEATKNVLMNMWMLEKMNPVSRLKEILPSEVPVIVVSAGPSLDKNIEMLRRAKGHCLILAVDTALPYLLQRDILPDLTITVEPIKPVKHYLDPRSEEIPAIFDCESNPEITCKHRDRVFIYNCRGYVRRLLEAVGKNVPEDVAGGGSVATAAFAILYQLEVKHIILIGQDLAYSGEATHAGGVESKGINNNIGYEMIEDINGGQVRTRSDWLGYLRWFESAISVINNLGKDIHVTDATEGGAKIHGSEIMTLAEALEKYCGIKTADLPDDSGCAREIDYDFEKELSRLPSFLNGEEYALFLEKKDESLRQLEEMSRQACLAVDICDRLIPELEKGGKMDEKRVKASEKELAEIRAFCEKCYIYPMVNDYAVSDIAEEVSRLRLEAGDESLQRLNEIRQQRLAFEAIERACRYIKAVR